VLGERRLLLCLSAVFVAVTYSPSATAGAEPDTFGFTVFPGEGAPGTLVHYEGDVPVEATDFEPYRMPDFAYGLALVQEDTPTLPECSLIIPVKELTKSATDDGHVTGSFVVGSVGGCFMSDTDVGRQRARPGVYAILLSCHACTPIGMFRITSEPLARTGHATAPLAGAGVGLIALGVVFVAASRRTPPSRSRSCVD
jgi:hypothetical protein